MNGLLVLNKPRGITSRDAVNRAQQWFPRKTKIGHTGTLDPLATGVLVLCVGSATRLTEYVQDLPKTYETMLRLGARSDTDDADGTTTHVAGVVPPTIEVIQFVLETFIGIIEQVPPAYSAAHVSGERAHERARRGEEVTLKPRPVRIESIEVLGYAYPHLRLRIDCGKGTYIRSIARDLGDKLGCGGYVEALRRTRLGPFTPVQAVPLEADAASARGWLLPPLAAVAYLPRVTLYPTEAERFRTGQSVGMAPRVGGLARATVAVFDTSGRLIGIGSQPASL